MSIQVIKKDGKPEWAILPYSDYIELLSDHEDHKKIKTFKEKLSRRQEDLVPKDIVNQIISGKNPIKAYREFRKLSLSELANKTNLSISYLSQLEHNDRKGSANSLKNIASALMIGIDDLL